MVSTLQADSSGRFVAILDQRPGRAVSLVYRQFLAGLRHSYYLTPPINSSGFAIPEGMTTEPAGLLGIDLENTRTILSLGTPLYDGWGTPGRLMRLRRERAADGDERQIRVIQAETRHSTTAAFADSWLPIKPGTEAPLALGLARVIVDEHLVDIEAIRREAVDLDGRHGSSYLDLLSHFPCEKVAATTGLDAEKIRETARILATRAPSVVIGAGDPGGGPLGIEDETAVWGLNLIIGAVGRPGGFRQRRQLPEPRLAGGREPVESLQLAQVPDHSIRLLILDGAEAGASLPWNLIQKKLDQENSMVVSLSPMLPD